MEFKETIKLIFQKDISGQIIDLRNYFLRGYKRLSPKLINQTANVLRISTKPVKKALHINKYTDTKDLNGFNQVRAKTQF